MRIVLMRIFVIFRFPNFHLLTLSYFNSVFHFFVGSYEG